MKSAATATTDTNGSVIGKKTNSAAMEKSLHDDLASPASNGNDENESRAHSFRERRLTYTRHHILTDSAAAAVAEMLADGVGFSADDGNDDDDDDDDDDTEKSNSATEPNATEAMAREKRKIDDNQSSSPTEDENKDQQQQHLPRKRARFQSDGSSGNKNGSPGKNADYLPSKILHAGEIVRRHSGTVTSAVADLATRRTGMHKNVHKENKENKWRRRFSFCSTVPDHVLPFPRHVVGTYSCHGMEPVYDSDYDDNDESSDDGGSDTEKTSTAKINQDRGGIAYPYANSIKQALFAVYDGHGEGGEMVSQYALGEVQRLLEGRLRSLMTTSNGSGELGCITEEGSDKEDEDGAEDEEASSEEQKQKHQQNKEEKEGEFIAQAMRETFVKVDRGLLDEIEIEPMYSGTTACAVLLRNNKLYISNCGDSRAVLVRWNDPNKKNNQNDNNEKSSSTKNVISTKDLTTIDLSIDQNPDSPGEQERILTSGGYVSPPPEPGLSSRVWLDAANTQIGLAMARSIGDHAVKGVGVIAEPVVTSHELQKEDEFVIIATDGVWEFISSEDAMEIVSEYLYKEDGSGGASVACEALIKAASEKWHEHEGNYRDDITAIVIRLKDLWNDLV